MIVTCPNCGARYRLSDEVVARRARLKCAACDQRWVPEPEAETVEAAPEPEPPEPPPPEPPAPEPEPAWEPPEEEEEEEEPRSHLVRNIVAVVLGLALTITAAGLWVGQVDTSRIPVVGDTLSRLVPVGQPLDIGVSGVVTQLPSGGRVLDVTGTITNRGQARARVPLLRASLAGPDGPARRWTIAPPVTELAPGASATFTSTIIGFPPAATRLSITVSR
ncbi:zinc-ribbon domain-containing protein [Sandarakinorhabdus sp. DWP1-3-1]|uniref:zinc-ribbon domain-containing protein n=1 Tax=Sandarakinorhabdus sp. DWP1-3-1 TaxID=2804627 RepID=UPI003CEF3EA5